MTVYARPGAEGSADVLPAPLRELDRRRVGRARQGPVLREPHPGQRQAVLRGRRAPPSRHRAGAGRRARGRPGLGQDVGGRAGRDPEQDRRPHRGEPRIHRRRRVLGQRQADPRDAQRRHPAGRRPLPLLRRRDPRAGRLAVPDRRRHRRLPLPRAARRRRPDHPVELPDPDGHLEARPGPGRRQLPSCSSPPSRRRRRSWCLMSN